ncbi:hypothetical protein PVL29_004613 [Vitis rotundifolia]|uniref:Uncharacterized protein n=1 Tax=Vitis rotundifolia TaxID=103349 RepID=A0AA39E190_VITRO|nr:hypothetical protein PVL29_004613 [Vitis rotundifolia]
MGQVPKPLMTVVLTLIVCSYSQAHRNLRQSPGGPDPIHDMEDPMKSEAYGIYEESPKGSNAINSKMEGQRGTNNYGIYGGSSPEGLNPIHNKVEGQRGTNTYGIYGGSSLGGPNPIHNKVEVGFENNANDIYRESSGGANPIHQKIKGHMGTDAFKIY